MFNKPSKDAGGAPLPPQDATPPQAFNPPPATQTRKPPERQASILGADLVIKGASRAVARSSCRAAPGAT